MKTLNAKVVMMTLAFIKNVESEICDFSSRLIFLSALFTKPTCIYGIGG